MTDDHGDRIADALRDAASAFDRGPNAVGKVLAGAYTAADAADDVTWFTTTGVRWMSELALCWSQLVSQPASVEPRDLPTVGQVGEPIQVTLHAGAAVGPMTLAAGAFRAIGWGYQFVLGAGAVRFSPDPPTLLKGTDTFSITVHPVGLPPQAVNRTLIFEGMVVDSATSAEVAGPIRVVKPAHSV